MRKLRHRRWLRKLWRKFRKAKPMTIGGIQDDTTYVLLAADGSRAVFNDPADDDYVGMARFTGLDDSEVTEVTDLRTEADGGTHGNFWRGRRPVVANIEFAPESTTDRNTRYDKIMRAIGNSLRTDSTLTWTPDGSAEQFIRVRKQGPVRRADEPGWLTRIQIPMVAANPFKYSTALHSADESTVDSITYTAFKDYVLALDPSLYISMATNFNDLTGNGGSGVAGGGVTAGSYATGLLAGVSGEAGADFDGTNDSVGVALGENPWSAGGAVTIAGWARRDASGSADGLFKVFSSGGLSANLGLRLASGSQDVVFEAPETGGDQFTFTAAWPGNGVDVAWALVLDDSGEVGTGDLYINGEFIGTGIGMDTWHFDLREASPAAWLFGENTASGYFDGKLSDMPIWPRRLTQAEIAGLAGTGSGKLNENAGNAPTAPLIRINGASTDPVLHSLTTGESLALDYTLDAGDFIEVDFAARSVTLNDSGVESNLYSAITGTPEWWLLAPGDNLLFIENATDYEISWRDAWQ